MRYTGPNKCLSESLKMSADLFGFIAICTDIVKKRMPSSMDVTLRRMGVSYRGRSCDFYQEFSRKRLTCLILKIVVSGLSLISLVRVVSSHGSNFRSPTLSHWRLHFTGMTLATRSRESFRRMTTLVWARNSATVYMSFTMFGSKFKEN